MTVKFSLFVNDLLMKKNMTYHHARTLANRFLDGKVEIKPQVGGDYGSTEIHRNSTEPRRYGVSLVEYHTSVN